MRHDIDTLSPENTCFVVSPIGDDNSDVRERADELLDSIIEPAAVDNGLQVVRSDQIGIPGMITTQVISHIMKDRMLVADLTDQNPNVFYELALRHAFRKPVVQMMASAQKLPFDVVGVRAILYDMSSVESRRKARDVVSKHMASSLGPHFEVESPVSIAASLDELSRTSKPEIQTMFKAVLDQISALNNSITDMTSSGLLCRPDDLREVIPSLVRDQTAEILRRYSEEIELLKLVRFAGIYDIHKRRHGALKAFARDIDEETTEIMLIGSSLKGLLQKDEYREIAEKLRFKVAHKTEVKFMLTHPIIADLRSSQENRKPTEIGIEILTSLKTLETWGVEPSRVRLYLGTPTCFAIKTTRRMIVNQYPYMSVSYDSPCVLVQRSSVEGVPGYFFDEFASRHFGAWDTGLAVPVRDFGETIRYCEEMMQEWADNVSGLLDRGRSFK